MSTAPQAGGLRDVHDRLSILRRDLASVMALMTTGSLAGVRLEAAIDLLDGLLVDLERFGVAA